VQLGEHLDVGSRAEHACHGRARGVEHRLLVPLLLAGHRRVGPRLPGCAEHPQLLERALGIAGADVVAVGVGSRPAQRRVVGASPLPESEPDEAAQPLVPCHVVDGHGGELPAPEGVRGDVVVRVVRVVRVGSGVGCGQHQGVERVGVVERAQQACGLSGAEPHLLAFVARQVGEPPRDRGAQWVVVVPHAPQDGGG
jgi:hypothetical protein